MSSHSRPEPEVDATWAWIEKVIPSVIYLQTQNGKQMMMHRMSVLLTAYYCVRTLSLSRTKSTLPVTGIERTLRLNILS